ncbi:MAG TPA: ATP-binding protein [Thermodesulfobacteriota bacterium]
MTALESHQAPRQMPGRILALMLLRVLVILGGCAWYALAWPGLAEPRLVAAILVAVLAYGLFLLRLLWHAPERALRWNAPVTALDIAAALALVAFTGGARSDFFLAIYLIVAIQAYYYGLRRGLVVAVGAAALYLAVVRPTVEPSAWPDYAVRAGMVVVTAVCLGVLAEAERREQETIRSLNRRLEAQRREVRAILDGLRDGVVALDRQWRVVGWNRAMAERFGLSEAQAHGQPITRFLPQLRDGGRAEPPGRLAGGDPAERLVHVGPTGEPMILNIRASPVANDGGDRDAAAVLLIEDATERVALEQAARRAETLAAIGALATGIAHEINNPIGIATTRIELLLEDAGGTALSPSVREDLAVLRQQLLRAGRVARGLLSLTRRGAGRTVEVDLNAVVQETLLLVGKQVRDEGIRLSSRLAPDLPPVRGDGSQLAQALLSLVDNAREAITPPGEIAVETGPDPERPGWVCLRVRDTGRGIPPERHEAIFDPLYTTKPAGTGLGLAVTAAIVREHGGQISVESRDGEGTTFTVRLPSGRPDA